MLKEKEITNIVYKAVFREDGISKIDGVVTAVKDFIKTTNMQIQKKE